MAINIDNMNECIRSQSDFTDNLFARCLEWLEALHECEDADMDYRAYIRNEQSCLKLQCDISSEYKMKNAYRDCLI